MKQNRDQMIQAFFAKGIRDGYPDWAKDEMSRDEVDVYRTLYQGLKQAPEFSLNIDLSEAVLQQLPSPIQKPRPQKFSFAWEQVLQNGIAAAVVLTFAVLGIQMDMVPQLLNAMGNASIDGMWPYLLAAFFAILLLPGFIWMEYWESKRRLGL